MKKIGIFTFHRAENYGAVLQACALNDYIKDSVIVDYRNKILEKPYKLVNFSSIMSFLKSILFLRKNYKRKKSFESFIKNNLSLIKYDDIGQLDVLVTGSDQVWSKKILGELSEVYTLNVGKPEVRRISYAASVGDSKSICDNSNDYEDKLQCLDRISVRENDAKIELSKIINKDIEVVLDPTLIEPKIWNNKLKNMGGVSEPYIFAYVISPDEEYMKIVNYISEITGLRIIHFGKTNKGYKNVLKSAYTEGPLEFVNYIKNAEYVVATSFHATVFSIIFNKKFFIVPHRKTGARVTNLLDKLGITGRTFSTLEEFKKIDYNFETDWKKVEEKLDIEREKSINWLKNAIEGEMN